MADSEQEPKTSTTVADGTEAPDNQPKSEEQPKSDAPAEDAPAADAGSDDDEGSDAGKSDDDDKGDDSAAQKERNRSQYRVRQLVSNNPRMQAIRERLQPWIEDTQDPAEKRDRQRDVNDYIRDAARAQDDIQRDSEAVAKEIPQFNPADKDNFDADLYQRAMAQYARDMCIEDQNGIVDKAGNPIIVGYRMRLIDYMREKAEDYGLESKSPKSGKQPNNSSNTGKSGKSKTDKAKMDAAADTPGGASAASSKTKGSDDDDPFLVGFNDPYGRHTPQNKHAWTEK